MRRMKCLSCNKEWYVRDGEENKVLTCPFCSSPIREKASVSGTDTLGKALYKAIAERSLDILSSSSKIAGYLFDIAPELKKETRIFSKTFDDELVSRFRDAFEQDRSEAEITIGMLRTVFVEEEGLSDSWADMLCEGCLEAIYYFKGIGLSDKINADISDDIYSITEHRKTEPCELSVPVEKAEKPLSVLKPSSQPAVAIPKKPVQREIKADNRGKSVASSSSKRSVELTEPDADYYEGCTYEKNGDTTSALEYYRRSRYIKAFVKVAALYEAQDNYKKAWLWYSKAADANDPDGLYYVGMFYLLGKHVAKDYHSAIRYFEKSSSLGNDEATVALGICNKNGYGCSKDVLKANQFFEDAVKNGNGKADYYLGLSYLEGTGVTKDIQTAAKLFQDAVRKGVSDAETSLQECISQMSFSQKIKWNIHKSN